MLQPCSVLEEESVVGDSSSLVDSEPVVYGNVKVTDSFLLSLGHASASPSSGMISSFSLQQTAQPPASVEPFRHGTFKPLKALHGSLSKLNATRTNDSHMLIAGYAPPMPHNRTLAQKTKNALFRNSFPRCVPKSGGEEETVAYANGRGSQDSLPSQAQARLRTRAWHELVRRH